MLTSVYYTLELFDTAFANTGSVATSLVIDCTGATRWAEGVEHGRPWRIEAQQSQGRPIDGVMLKRAYGHMGRHLFVAFHGAAQRKVHALGWRDAEAQAAVEATVRPVLEAMDFHMGMAVKNGWLSRMYHSEYSGGVRVEDPFFSVEDVVRWSQLDVPGRWTSLQLMEMFLQMDAQECSLNARNAERWIAAHPVEHREAVRDILRASFALHEGVHCRVEDPLSATQAWTRWWALMPVQPLGQSAMANITNVGESKGDAIMEGWYLRAAASKRLSNACLPAMGEVCHGFEATLRHGAPVASKTWERFQRALRHAVYAYPQLVWKDRAVQAWMLHKVFAGHEETLRAHPALQGNPVHDYIALQSALENGERHVHEYYPLWVAMRNTAVPTLAQVDTTNLFSAPN